MFDYDKIVKRLSKFEELPPKKRKKVLTTVFCSEEFREWFYGVGDNKNAQPMTNSMIQQLFNLLARPVVVKAIMEFIDEHNCNEFDHTACSIAFNVVDQGIESLNKANGELNEDAKNGVISNKEMKQYKEKSDQYTGYMSELLSSIKGKASGEVKEICKKSNLPKTLVYTTYFIVPGRKYIPKYKTTMYMNQMLREIYKWVGTNGIDNISLIRWGNLFGSYFGMEMTTSAAVAILIEGVKRIEPYQDMPFFNDVKSVWNSLTNFALAELDNAPENVRRQMIELYIKKIDRIFKNGNTPILRINILNIPKEFANLSDTVMRYADRISSITKISVKPIVDLKTKYIDKKNDDDEDDEEYEDKVTRRLMETTDRVRDRKDKNRNQKDDRRKFDNIFEKSSRKRDDDDEDDSNYLLKGIKPEKLWDVDPDEVLDESDDDEDIGSPPVNTDDDEI